MLLKLKWRAWIYICSRNSRLHQNCRYIQSYARKLELGRGFGWERICKKQIAGEKQSLGCPAQCLKLKWKVFWINVGVQDVGIVVWVQHTRPREWRWSLLSVVCAAGWDRVEVIAVERTGGWNGVEIIFIGASGWDGAEMIVGACGWDWVEMIPFVGTGGWDGVKMIVVGAGGCDGTAMIPVVCVCCCRCRCVRQSRDDSCWRCGWVRCSGDNFCVTCCRCRWMRLTHAMLPWKRKRNLCSRSSTI